MLGAGDATVSLSRHQAAGLSPVIVVGKSAAPTVKAPENVRSIAAARRQVLVREMVFITFRFLFGGVWYCSIIPCIIGDVAKEIWRVRRKAAGRARQSQDR